MISVSGVSKTFGATPAVDDVSFDAADGTLTYLLGPNGAGKTTVLRMIAGLSRPDAGTITVNGRALREHRDLKREIGVSLSAFSRNPAHTAARHLTWQARLGGIAVADVGRVLDLVGLAGVSSRPVGRFSFGMLQRLGIASALLGDPRTVVLDEPANGLDVEGTLWLRELLRRLADQGKSLLVASHSLAEVEITADRIVVMGRGRVLSDSTRDAIVARGTGPRPLESAYLEITSSSVEYAGAQSHTGDVR